MSLVRLEFCCVSDPTNNSATLCGSESLVVFYSLRDQLCLAIVQDEEPIHQALLLVKQAVKLVQVPRNRFVPFR